MIDLFRRVAGNIARHFQIGCKRCPHAAFWHDGEGCNCIRTWEITNPRSRK